MQLQRVAPSLEPKMSFNRNHETERLDQFETGNCQLIKAIAATLLAVDCPSEALDELVHDAAANIDPANAEDASDLGFRREQRGLFAPDRVYSTGERTRRRSCADRQSRSGA